MLKTIKVLCAFLIMLTTVFCTSSTVFGAAGNIETERNSSLEINFRDGEKAIPEAEFSVYFIANIDEQGRYTVAEEFNNFNVNITGKNDEAWRVLASALEGFVYQNGSVPTANGKTDSEGILRLTGLKPGLYLVIGNPISFEGFTYFAETAIIQIPALNNENNVWNYDVSIKPKYSFIPDIEPDGFVERRVIKIWNDKGFESIRPNEITVYIFCDGKIYDTVTLNKDNNWRYSWDKLEEGHRWLVSEKIPEGYTVEIRREGITFVIENSIKKEIPPEKPNPPEEPEEPKLPQTGQLWWPVPVLFGIGLLFVAVGIFRRRGNYEK